MLIAIEKRGAALALENGIGGLIQSFPERDAHEQELYSRHFTLISSWHQSATECLALWKIYARDGVAIESTIPQLLFALDFKSHNLYKQLKWESQSVEYDLSKLVKGSDGLTNYFIKRPAYSYEQEFRVAIDLSAATPMGIWDDIGDELLDSKGASFPIDLKKLINKVVVSPSAKNWEVEAVKSIASDFEIVRSTVELR